MQLIPREVSPNGIFGPFHSWLDQQILENKSHGFFRPYSIDQGGVAPERWHLSFAPESILHLQAYTLELFKRNISQSKMTFREHILKNAEDIYQRYVKNISSVPF